MRERVGLGWRTEPAAHATVAARRETVVREPIQISNKTALISLAAVRAALFLAGVSARLVGVYGWKEALRTGCTILRTADG